MVIEGERASKELIEKLEQVSSASIFSSLWELGCKNFCMPNIVPITLSNVHVYGTAVTIKYLPLKKTINPEEYRQSPTFKVVDILKKGDILVMGALGRRVGLMGDVMASGFKVKGVSAIVIDGGVRDVPLIRKMELPVFAKYATPAHIADTLVSAELNTSIECDGVQVNAGDIIVGDDDGVVVIPKEVAPEAIERGWRHEKLDLESRKRILAGMPLGEAYPPREEWLKEK